MYNYDLYGLIDHNLLEAKIIIEKLLKINFKKHESSYYGIYYKWCSEKDTEEISLKTNFDFEKEPLEYEFSKYKILLYIDETNRSLKLKSILLSLSSIILLREEFL